MPVDAVQFLLRLFENRTLNSLLSCHQFAVQVLQFLRWTTLIHPRPLFTLPCLLQATLHLFVALSVSWLTSAMATEGKSEVCVKKFPNSALNFRHGSLRPLLFLFLHHLITQPAANPLATSPVPPPPSAPKFTDFVGKSSLHCRRSGCSAVVVPSCPVRFCQAQCTSPRCPTHSTVSRRRECRARGCTSLVPRSCSSGFCESHCTSPRCTWHRRRVPVCSTVGCTADADQKCVVGSCLAHCTHTSCGPIGGSPRSTLRLCRIPSCSERVHPECSTRCCTLHCSSSRCPFHVSPNGVGAPGEHPTRVPIACSTRGHIQCTATLAPR